MRGDWETCSPHVFCFQTKIISNIGRSFWIDIAIFFKNYFSSILLRYYGMKIAIYASFHCLVRSNYKFLSKSTFREWKYFSWKMLQPLRFFYLTHIFTNNCTPDHFQKASTTFLCLYFDNKLFLGYYRWIANDYSIWLFRSGAGSVSSYSLCTPFAVSRVGNGADLHLLAPGSCGLSRSACYIGANGSTEREPFLCIYPIRSNRRLN